MMKIKAGNYPCPICQPEKRPKQNALSVRYEGETILLHCHKSHCEFQDIADNLGLLEGEKPRGSSGQPRPKAELLRYAKKIWHETRPVANTWGQAYLEARGITPPYPPSIRFHPRLYHLPTEREYPALIGQFGNKAITRIYLDWNEPRKAKIKPAKMALGETRGEHIGIKSGRGSLIITEGLEDGLSVAQLSLMMGVAVWTCLSATQAEAVKLPKLNGRRLLVALDNDEAGNKSAKKLMERAKAEGWIPERLTPPKGKDWNEYLLSNTK